ncbi:Ig-like domain-containing protein [Candidatus Uhrbacteria bacterium]|nr:Ig-like domain-containing protein [Candidatus Uhrbacteria bacterium]
MAVFSFLFLAVASAAPVFAQGPDTAGLEAVGSAAGIAGSSDLLTIIGRIINVALGFVGILLLGLLLYAGYLWMTSGGEAAKVDQAKSYIRNAIIGLVIITSSFAIVSFILGQLAGVAGLGGGGAGPGGGGASGFPGSAGALGAGIIETHYPQRGATGVPRNTPIVITFKEPIRPESFIKDWTEATSGTVTGLNDLAVKIYPTADRTLALTSAQASVRFTADRKTFVIRPVDFLGNPTTDTDYTVELIGGRTGIILADGTAALGSSGYIWQFQVSTVVDNTPPRITAVIPSDGGRYAPNVVIQINFNEPIDPTAAGGLWDGTAGFTNIEVRATPAVGAEVRPSGEFRISNGYRTVEFTTDLACGTNSCGSTVYCLPRDSSIAVIAKAPTLSDTPPQAFLSGSGYDGIVDMVGNALDGNGDGDAQGSDTDSTPGNDDYGWTFGTESEPNLSAPRIESTDPIAGDLIDSSNQPLDKNPVANFDSVLQSSTVNSETVEIQSNEPSSMADTWWYSLSQDPLTDAGVVAGVGDIATKGRLTVDHRLYSPATSTGPGAVAPTYQPIIHSGVQNVYQNCFNPAASDRCTANSTEPNCCDGNSQTGACSDLIPTP